MMAAPKPTSVISIPLLNHDRPVTKIFAAPTTKCASVLMTNDHANASLPDSMKYGITGMNAPLAVLNVALIAAELAGLPVTAGLYALLLPVLVYAGLGATRRGVIGPEGAVGSPSPGRA